MSRPIHRLALVLGIAALTASPFPALAAEQGGSQKQPPKAGRPEKGHPGFVTRLDADGDGRVSKKEFDGPPEHFADFDRNRDGFISEEEAPKGPPPRRGGPPRFVERLDQDGDGKVSREEFDGPPEHFDHFDENGDGLIERSEAPAGPPPGPGRRQPLKDR